MFESARSKIERADKHISDLKGAFDAFIETHPHTLSIGSDPNTGEMTVEVRFREKISSTFALIIGDAVHNLRTALDHATWELIGLDKGTQDRWTAFPTSGQDRINYEATCNGIKTPRADTKKFFIDFAAYPGGAGQKIWGLNALDNDDKHTVLTPIFGAAKVAHMKVLNPNGSVAMTMKDCTFGMGPDSRARMMRLGRGMTIEFDQDADMTIDVFFGDIDMFKFSPIVKTLESLRDAISEIVGKFDEFVRARK